MNFEFQTCAGLGQIERVPFKGADAKGVRPQRGLARFGRVPHTRPKSGPTTESSHDEVVNGDDLKRSYLEIEASSGASSFEIEKLRLSAFQNGAFC